MTKEEIENLAEACHEVNRVYCELIGDNSQVPWIHAPKWQRESAINGVEFYLKKPETKPADSHNNWMKEKLADGWKHGPIKDETKKEHPSLIPYEKLPETEAFKDILFLSVIKAAERIIDGEA